MPLKALSRQEVDARLAELPGWSVEGDRLTRAYDLGSHLAAAALVGDIARVQDELDHHSDLTLGYRTVTLAVNTHSAGDAVTEADIALARRVEALASGHEAT
ncbi:4a-hydroxytetrahydrobiopterin dehydratase [Streptomyces griseoviridis]|uniref:4a-hydroxytetrahydrobiopterin dehydratase n=1 Tax=Streptomyces griseoviridis TaxID=45398 RepID=UPI003429FC25